MVVLIVALTVAQAMGIYLLFFRPFIKERYPIFYAYLLVSCLFDLFLYVCELDSPLDPAAWVLAYQLIYLFQLYLLAYLWREVLQRDYPSLRLLINFLMVLSSLLALAWSIETRSPGGPVSALRSGVLLNGLAAPSFFSALLLVFTFRKLHIPVPRHLRGMIYGVTLLTGFDFLAIFVSNGPGFVTGYARLYPLLLSLAIYCRFLSSPQVYDHDEELKARFTTNANLLALDQRIFYGFMVKTRLYNPLTQAYYYRFCSPHSSWFNSPIASKAHFQKLYSQNRFFWAAEPYYRLVDPLILGSLYPTNLGLRATRLPVITLLLALLVLVAALVKLSMNGFYR